MGSKVSKPKLEIDVTTYGISIEELKSIASKHADGTRNAFLKSLVMKPMSEDVVLIILFYLACCSPSGSQYSLRDVNQVAADSHYAKLDTPLEVMGLLRKHVFCNATSITFDTICRNHQNALNCSHHFHSDVETNNLCCKVAQIGTILEHVKKSCCNKCTSQRCNVSNLCKYDVIITSMQQKLINAIENVYGIKLAK